MNVVVGTWTLGALSLLFACTSPAYEPDASGLILQETSASDSDGAAQDSALYEAQLAAAMAQIELAKAPPPPPAPAPSTGSGSASGAGTVPETHSGSAEPEAAREAEMTPDVIPVPPTRNAAGGWDMPVGDGLPPISIPANERLVYSVIVDVGLFDTRVGTVTLESNVTEETNENGEKQLVGFLGSHARGAALGFAVDNRLSVQLIDQAWPRMDYSDIETGTGPHMRTLQVGTRDGKFGSYYRRDGHCKVKGCKRKEHMNGGRFWNEKGYHCRKCRRVEHRIWRDPVEMELPPDTVDMLSAVYMARAALNEGRKETTFHMVETDDLWKITVVTGREDVLETPAGSFAVSEVKLIPKPATKDEEDSNFKGMFGLHGSIELWFQTETGVPVCIRGTVPVGPLDFDVLIELEAYRGTPAAFGPL